MSMRASVVESPLVAPNYSGSSLSPISSSNHSPMMDSRCLVKIGVRDMGRRSLSTFLGGCTFGIGTTFALFHKEGKVPSLIDELKVAQMGLKIKPARSRRTQLGSRSGPTALLILVLISFSTTFSLGMMYLLGISICSGMRSHTKVAGVNLQSERRNWWLQKDRPYSHQIGQQSYLPSLPL